MSTTVTQATADKRICYTQPQVDAMATYKTKCDIDRLDLQSTQKAYEGCLNAQPGEPAFYEKPLFVGIVGVTIGVIIRGLLK